MDSSRLCSAKALLRLDEMRGICDEGQVISLFHTDSVPRSGPRGGEPESRCVQKAGSLRLSAFLHVEPFLHENLRTCFKARLAYLIVCSRTAFQHCSYDEFTRRRRKRCCINRCGDLVDIRQTSLRSSNSHLRSEVL